jgi:hypothetical protein
MDKYSEIKKLINTQPPIDMNTYLSQDVKDALKKELEIKKECERIERDKTGNLKFKILLLAVSHPLLDLSRSTDNPFRYMLR